MAGCDDALMKRWAVGRKTESERRNVCVCHARRRRASVRWTNLVLSVRVKHDHRQNRGHVAQSAFNQV